MYKDVETQPDFPAIEREILRFWEMERPFEALRERNKGRAKWSFFDGPITANNPMGVHHAWGRTFKDIFQRHRAMLGFDQRYQNGFDCQGLWVEVEVEKELGLNSKRDIMEYGLDRFAEQCKARVRRFADRQTEQSIRLGQWMDWDHSYYTYTDTNIETIWRFLAVCQEKGWLYRGHRSMPWCWRCETPLSQHELADSYQDMTHRAVTIKLPIEGPLPEFLLVWTTTPWTLTANVAVAVNPKLTYLKVKQGDELLYVAEGAKAILKGEYEVVEQVKGKDLVGLKYTGPTKVAPREGLDLKVISWDDVGAEEGTGMVHIAPGCGAEDFELAKTHKLPVLVPIGEDGRLLPEYAPFAGKAAIEVADEVFAHLQSHGYLYKTEDYEHRYPVCWRCKKELVFRVSDSVWFIKVDEIRPLMMAAAAKVDWIPEYAGKRMIDWLENMGDWCISRNRFWGLPLPFFPCACGELTVIGGREQLAAAALSGMQELTELHRPWIDALRIKCPKCGEAVERVEEVGDCWLDAGIIPFSTLEYGENKEHWAEWFPAEFITEMVEQTRLWFYATLFMSVALEGKAPYKTVKTYETVTDEDGERISKTKQNGIPFDDAVERMGADVMRWLYASVPTERNLRFGFTLGDEARRKLLTLWNTYRFFVTYAQIDNPDKLDGKLASAPHLTDIDRWIMARLQELIETCRDRLEHFDSATMMREVERYLDDLSNWYVRRSRKRFWRSTNDKDKAIAYRTLYHCLKALIQLLAPVLPFVTEKIYQNLVRQTEEEVVPSVHLCKYPKIEGSLINPSIIEDMQAAARVCQLGHSIRAAQHLKNRQPLREVIIKVDNPALERGIQTFSGLIQQELNVKAVKLLSDLSSVQTYIVKPNFRLLGRKYGAEVPKIQAAIAAAEPRELARRVFAGEKTDLRVEGTVYTLAAEELEVQTQFSPHLAAMEDKELVVALSTKLTPELQKEGLARDVMRHIQEQRKQAGFHVTDRIAIQIHAGELVGAALDQWGDEVKTETLADSLDRVEEAEAVRGDATTEATIGGEPVQIGVRRVY